VVAIHKDTDMKPSTARDPRRISHRLDQKLGSRYRGANLGVEGSLDIVASKHQETITCFMMAEPCQRPATYCD
jgi:hypothetical protein